MLCIHCRSHTEVLAFLREYSLIFQIWKTFHIILKQIKKRYKNKGCFLARLYKIQEELLQSPRCRRTRRLGVGFRLKFLEVYISSTSIITHLRDLGVKVMDFWNLDSIFQVKFLDKVFRSLYLLNFMMDLLATLPVVWYCLKFYARAITTCLYDLQVKVMDFEISLLCFKLKFLEVYVSSTSRWI